LRKSTLPPEKSNAEGFVVIATALFPELPVFTTEMRLTQEPPKARTNGEHRHGRRNSLADDNEQAAKKVRKRFCVPAVLFPAPPNGTDKPPFGRLLAFFSHLPQMNGMAKVKIMVNGEARITEARTIDELCRELGLAAELKIATARNGEFVPAKSRATVTLAEGDAIEVLSPRQGG
jgi:sulfur carrier protein